MAQFVNIEDFLGTLTVSPEIMRQKSYTVLGKIQEIRAFFEELEQTVNKTMHYWMGEAADVHRAYLVNRKPEMEEIFRRLMEHVDELNQMATVYTKAEQEAKAIAEDLPSDVIA